MSEGGLLERGTGQGREEFGRAKEEKRREGGAAARAPLPP